ncbi:hypothetical protein [Methylocapsa aurea]|nr:hypothetical protein [Methylocapsa aurea]
MRPRSRSRTSRLMNRPDLVYAALVAMIICIGLIARGIGLLPPH